jgi:hypothetical protein
MEPVTTSVNRRIETPYVRLELRPDGILVAWYKKGTKIDLPTAHEIVASRIAFTGESTFPVLLYIEGLVTIEREARAYISSPEGVKYLSAAAIMEDSPFAAAVGNLFSTLNNPFKIPVRIFTKPQSAIIWLLDKHLQWTTAREKDKHG